MKTAFITGITGQDGSYLAELLLGKGYEVYGLVRRVANPYQEYRLSRISHLLDDIRIVDGDIRDYGTLVSFFDRTPIDEIYHLAAQSDVAYSFRDPRTTFAVNIDGTLNLLECMRHYAIEAKMYFAGSSEMFGKVQSVPQHETTPFYPRSPYGVSKVAGFELCRNYREAYNLHINCGILFNHESPRRGEEFVTQKIAQGVAQIATGKREKINLGNMRAKRDWGHARDYVLGMWKMLQQKTPGDYVLATGETHTVEEFAKRAFALIGIENYMEYIYIDPEFKRPAEVDLLIGNATLAKERLGWSPEVTFNDLVDEMVENALCEANYYDDLK